MDRFTEEELAIAKSVDLVDVAAALGYTPKRIGRCLHLECLVMHHLKLL